MVTYTRAIWRRRAPTARMIPISPVCSATSVDIVFETSTTAESSASRVITPMKSAKAAVSSLPGQSPGGRTDGRLVNPPKPGTEPEVARTSSIVCSTAAGLGSRTVNASRPYPGSPLSAATVSAGA